MAANELVADATAAAGAACCVDADGDDDVGVALDVLAEVGCCVGGAGCGGAGGCIPWMAAPVLLSSIRITQSIQTPFAGCMLMVLLGCRQIQERYLGSAT